jgi:hypothetical protein
MKINCGTDGLENLDDFSYIFKRDVYRRGALYYEFRPKCEVCGSSFFMRISYPTSVCSCKCSNRLESVRIKISSSLKGIKRSNEEKIAISKRMSKGGVVKNNLPLFDTYAKQLVQVESVRRNSNNLLEVKCTLCNKWFVPKRTAVEARAQFIKGNVVSESKLYCSEACKYNCSVFNKHKYIAGKNPRKSRNTSYYSESQLRTWSKEVLKRANYKCEYCGEKAKHAHHIKPKKLEPFYALDPDNGIACCVHCHYKFGHSGDCATINIASKAC